MASGRDIALFSARTADDKRAEDIIVYDVRGMTDVTDYFVIATASSRSQIRAIIESIKKLLKVHNVRKIGQEGDENGQWVLVDFGDCVIHVFSEQLRQYYSIESLWGDAPKLNWKKELPKELPLDELIAESKKATA